MTFSEAELIEGFKRLGWEGLFKGAEQEVAELVKAMLEAREENNGTGRLPVG
jgi:hypothetical protein